MSACRGCGAPIIWVRMRTGAAMPCDPAPDERGNVIATHTRAGWRDGFVLPADTKDRIIPRGYSPLIPHWATCPRPPKRRGRPPSERQP